MREWAGCGRARRVCPHATGSGFPAVKKGGDRDRIDFRHALELPGALDEELPTIRSEDDECRDAFLERDAVLPGDIEVAVVVADVDVDQ